MPTLGTIERIDPGSTSSYLETARVERIAEGFDWSEGPVWDPAEMSAVLGRSVNTVFKWQEGQGVSVFLKPSGYTGESARR